MLLVTTCEAVRVTDRADKTAANYRALRSILCLLDGVYARGDTGSIEYGVAVCTELLSRQ